MFPYDLSTEFQFQTTRSGGPGGQHVNKVETKVILRFNIAQSSLLPAAEKSRLLERLSERLIGGEVLSVSAQAKRSQGQNKVLAISKLYAILSAALQTKKARKPSQPSATAKTKSREAKQQQSEKKQWRRRIVPLDNDRSYE